LFAPALPGIVLPGYEMNIDIGGEVYYTYPKINKIVFKKMEQNSGIVCK
jgi:hypothetical protein